MNNKIAILYTTFLRDELMKKTMDSILSNWNNDYILLIGDQNPTEDKRNKLKALSNAGYNIEYIELPFDCGLSAARNALVKRAFELGIEFCLLTADSISFDEKYNLEPVMSFLRASDKRAIVGFELNNRISWEYDMELIPGKYFYLSIPKRSSLIENGLPFQPCDICRNIFLAKTSVLHEVQWDEQFKLLEHEDFAHRIKQAGYLVFYTDKILFDYILYKPSIYNYYRKHTSPYMKLLKKKYNITGWVQYEQVRNTKPPIINTMGV